MFFESTPILSGAIPAFKLFMTQWEIIMENHDDLKKYIKPGLDCTYKYYGRMDHTKAYIIAMRKCASPLPRDCELTAS
jgi:hypothetical protein